MLGKVSDLSVKACTNHKQTGVSYMVVDGERVDGNFVKYVDDGMAHTVEVYM